MAVKHFAAALCRLYSVSKPYTALILLCCCVGMTTEVFSQVSSLPAAHNEPQEDEEIVTPLIPHRSTNHALGFGVGVITGDASLGHDVLILTTQYSHRLSSVSELEFSVSYQSTAMILSPQPIQILFTNVTWNGDISVLTHPFAGWYNFRMGGGISIRRQVGNFNLTQTTVSPNGQSQTIREVKYQQALEAGASLKIDYLLYTNSSLEVSLRGQANVYAVPVSGERNQTPQSTPGGAVSIGLCFRAHF